MFRVAPVLVAALLRTSSAGYAADFHEIGDLFSVVGALNGL
jgi:hypothetical protein